MPYGVGAPLLEGLAADPALRLCRHPPRRLVEMLRAGELDAALVSSVEAFRRPGYAALADLGVACRRQARSVRAFRAVERPLRQIGVDDGSESSVALLQILLERVLGGAGGAYERIAPTTDVDSLPHDLVLLIGDAGLQATSARRQVLDLGELWYRWTGLPFVFALWILAPGSGWEELAARLRAGYRGSAPSASYEAAIHYRLDADDHRGLQRFAAEAAALGLADPDLAPTFVADPLEPLHP